MVPAAEQSKPQSTRRKAKHAENVRPVDICPKKFLGKLCLPARDVRVRLFGPDELVPSPLCLRITSVHTGFRDNGCASRVFAFVLSNLQAKY
jgi:hypothetical protein